MAKKKEDKSVRIDPDTHKILSQISEVTGIPVKRIIKEIVARITK